MSQRVSLFDLNKDKVHAEVDLPPFLALFADKVRDTLRREAPKLLE